MKNIIRTNNNLKISDVGTRWVWPPSQYVHNIRDIMDVFVCEWGISSGEKMGDYEYSKWGRLGRTGYFLLQIQILLAVGIQIDGSPLASACTQRDMHEGCVDLQSHAGKSLTPICMLKFSNKQTMPINKWTAIKTLLVTLCMKRTS